MKTTSKYPDDGNHTDGRYVDFGPSRAVPFPVGSHNIGTGGPAYVAASNDALRSFGAVPAGVGDYNQGGYVTNRVVQASPRVAVNKTISRLSSPEASSRTSTAISSLISNGQIDKLPDIISNLANAIALSSPGESSREALTQVLMEVFSALMQISDSSNNPIILPNYQ
ncbi:uncharacterized protein LOC128387827 [Panonychus citri]|uniref:uncharacterized protein LOC128387827 n=1 Tax=Panonychus citri TaxID=50023 RepID=UPI0023071F4B|nr:uncharacterized protein LOC128387827 [Panonychus citri]